LFLRAYEEDYDLPLLYWISKLHKCPHKQWYTAVKWCLFLNL